MREILFRGKRTDTGEWVEGYYVKGSTRHCITMSLANFPRYDVIPETVGQYTGLTDCNGKKIFEGDICLCDRNINDHIDKETFIIKFCSLNGWYGESKDGWSEFNGSGFEFAEVIGNIHDNPELLTGEGGKK